MNGVGRLCVHDPCIELDITRGLKRKRFRLLIALVCFWEEASDLVMISSIFAIYGHSDTSV